MAISVKYSAQYNTAIFVETEPGVFGGYVKPYATNTTVSTTGSTQTAVAVATTANYGVKSWTTKYNVSSEDGPILTVTKAGANANKPTSAAAATATCPKVTIIDDHGAHFGTPTMSAKRVLVSGATCAAVGVMHESTEDGWVFAGWRVTKKPQLSTKSMDYVTCLSAGGVTNGLVTDFDASESAVVLRISSAVDSTLDELTIEAIYEDASTPDPDPDPGITYCTLKFDPNAEDAAAPEIPDMAIGFGASGYLPVPNLWSRVGYEFSGWNTAANGSGAAYAAGALYTPAAGVYTVTMYAQWAKIGGAGVYVDSDSLNNVDTLGTKTYYSWPYLFALSAEGVDGVTVSFQDRQTGQRFYRTYDYTGALTSSVTTPGSDVYMRYASLPTSISYPASGHIIYTHDNYRADAGTYVDGEWKYGRSHEAIYNTRDLTWTWEAPEIAGYEFVGWYTLDASYSSTPTNPVYSVLISSDRCIAWKAIERGVNWTGTSRHTHHLRLRYRGKTVRVKFDGNGGTCDDYLREVNYMNPYGDLPVPSRWGHTFAGWYTARDGGSLVTAETTVTDTDGHTLYAHWSKDPIRMTVHFIPCGGTVSPTSKTVTSGEVYGDLPVPVRGDDEFQGWFTASMGGQKVTAATVVGHTYTHWLYAQWPIVPDESEEPDEPDLPEGGGMANMIDLI